MGRVIFLVDMNAFFISCEMARDNSLKGKPAAVAGDAGTRPGIILAANYEARKYKVKTTMTIGDAKRLCPGLILVPPDHSYYERKSREVMKILSRYTPVIQQNSIDEAWLDMTGSSMLFGEPMDIAGRIMKDIIDELDLWCSIGISENKFLAKMASEIKKPLGITELWQKDVKDKLWPLPVRDMYGIGKQTEKKLVSLSILTIGDIAQCKKELLVKYFGKYGEELHMLANGMENSPVVENPKHESKSISRSTTLPKDITDIESARDILMRLSEDVGEEARRYGYKGKTVSIAIKYGDFESITRQKSIKPTYLTKEIFNTGSSLLKENWNSSRPVRLLGIGLGNITEDCMEQISLFDIIDAPGCNDKKEENLEKVLDSIRARYGHDKIKRAKLL